MTRVVETAQSCCRAGVARCDITPPVGIYHRMWGAALHDRATGVHRPLTATALCLGAGHSYSPFDVILSLDHCILDGPTFARIRQAASSTRNFEASYVQVCLTHTHAAGLMSASRQHLPGGELIGPYLDELVEKCGRLACEAWAKAQAATVVYGTGRCNLASHRDFRDPITGQYVCGFNPDGVADDTLLVARIVADDGLTLGTVVNYACHPTTLGWQNTLISPDYVGALREVVERETEAPCLFLQGASGDLGPKEGFVGEPEAADANGRQVGYAALAVLESLPPPRTKFVYGGPVVSGATLGTWRYESWEPASGAIGLSSHGVDLSYRADLPALTETQAQLARWQAEEAAAHATGDAALVRDCRAQAERMTRQIARLESLPPGVAFPYRFQMLELGDAFWLFCPGELYQVFQTTLRSRFPDHPLVIATIADDWQPGYIPSAETYGKGIYQETISPLAPGSLETLIEWISRDISEELASRLPR